jgi:hypothetical protein
MIGRMVTLPRSMSIWHEPSATISPDSVNSLPNESMIKPSFL